MIGQGLLGALGVRSFGVMACDPGAADEPLRRAPTQAVAAIDGPAAIQPEQAPAVPTTYSFEGCSISCALSSCVVAEHSIECPANTFFESASCACDPTGIATCTTSSCVPNLGTTEVTGLVEAPDADLQTEPSDVSGDAYERPQTCYCGADTNPRASCTRTGESCTYLVTGPRPGTVIPILDQCRCDG